jgi:hypothetical protein
MQDQAEHLTAAVNAFKLEQDVARAPVASIAPLKTPRGRTANARHPHLALAA